MRFGVGRRRGTKAKPMPMRNRRRLQNAVYRGKDKAHSFGHFRMNKRIKAVRKLGDLKRMKARVRGLVTRKKWKNPKKGTQRQRYYSRHYI